MTQLTALNIKISGDSSDFSSEIATARAKLDSFEQKVTKSTTQTTKFSGSLGRLSNVSGQTRAQIQNTSFQLQDIAVQLQGGTKASTVFAQQLPQLLGGFGALGAALGVVAGVGIPALAFAFASAGDEAEDTEEAIDNLVGSLDAATKAFNRARIPVNDLREEFGRFGDEVSRASIIAAQAALSMGLEGLAGAVKEIEGPLANVQIKLAEYSRVVANAGIVQRSLGERTLLNAAAFDEQDEKVSAAASALSDAAAELGMTSAEATKLNIELKRLAEAEGMEAVAEQSSLVLDLLSKMFPASEKIPLAVAEIVTQLEAVLRAASAGVTAFEQMDAAAKNVTVGTPLFEQGFTGQGLLPPTSIDDDDGGGGGRARKDPLIGELERLEQSLMSQEELQIASFDRQQETLTNALEQQLLTKQEYDALMEDAEAQHAERMAGIAVHKYGDTLAQTGAFMGAMASAMQGGNEKMLKVARVFGAAEALINSYRAYNQVIADPTLPWFAKIPAAVSVLGAGLGMVNAIKGVSSGGGAGAASGGAAGSSGAAAQAPAQTSNNVAISLTGGDMFSRDQVIQLINGINDAVDDGAQIRLV
jgi:hypothetical protein